jgi:hypothetical protein
MNSIQALSRNTILDSVRANQPAAQPMPPIPRFPMNKAADLVAAFSQSVARMAGVVVTDDVPDLDSFLRAKLPDAKVICSAIPEYAGTIKPAASSVGQRRAQSTFAYCARRWVWPKPVPYCSPTSNCK